VADIADIGFRADTGGLKDAKASLDALVPSADRAEKSSVKLSSTLAKVDATADKLMAAATGLSSAVSKMSTVLDQSANAAKTTAAAQGTLSTASARVSVTFNSVAAAATAAASATTAAAAATSAAGASVGQLDSHVAAYRANLRQLKIDQMAAGSSTQQLDAHMIAYRDNLDKGGIAAKGAATAIKFGAQESLNASRQLADIGVTLAMGMNPFMVAIQQGPQLLDILQNKAAQTGQTTGAVFKAAGAAIWAALLPILPVILAIATAIGVVVAAFGLATREISKGNQDISKGLGLTDEQLKRVKKSGVETGVTIGDTFKATFAVLGEDLAAAFAGPMKSVKDSWNSVLDDWTAGGAGFIKSFVGMFVGAYRAIEALWKNMPRTFSGIAALIGNAFVAMFEGLLNRAIAQINGINQKINGGLSALGVDFQLAMFDNVKLGRFANAEAAATANAVAAGWAKGTAEGEKYAAGAMKRIGARARSDRAKLIRDAAGDAAAGLKAKKGPKSDGEKFEDIVTGANADIAKEKAREAAAGVNMTAEAAATLEYRTKLLNEAQSKGIKLTDGMRTKIDELASAYGKAKVAADNAVGLRDVLKASDADIAGIKTQIDMIGKYGRELAYATQMAKLLGDAKAKGMTPDAIAAAMPQFEKSAGEYADASAERDRSQFMEEQRKAAQERAITLQQEAAMIGMTADEANRYRIENELLAQARQKNIDLTPADIAALQGIAAEQAATEAAIRKTREAIDFAKDTAKGFFKEIWTGLSQGKSLWSSFADAAINAMNKIVDRLMDKAIEAGINALFKAFGYADGGVFTSGGVEEFANGGTFTNSVVNKPTMFASGGALGVMGEAGPEAVMPLQRGSDGSLGVQMFGGASGGTVIHAPISIQNDNRVTGAVSSADIVELQRRSAEQTKAQIAREVPGIIREFQQNGAVVR